MKKFCTLILLTCLLGEGLAQGAIIQSDGEFFSALRTARVVVTSESAARAVVFHASDEKLRKASFQATWPTESVWLVYIEGEDTIWLYRGGRGILRCKAAIADDGLDYTFEKTMFDIRGDQQNLPELLRAYFADTE